MPKYVVMVKDRDTDKVIAQVKCLSEDLFTVISVLMDLGIVKAFVVDDDVKENL